MFKINLILLITIFLLYIKITDSKPLQYLEPRKGYIPVYIRFGDTPLNEINPLLAEAFHENTSNLLNRKSIQELNKKQKLQSINLSSSLIPQTDDISMDDLVIVHNSDGTDEQFLPTINYESSSSSSAASFGHSSPSSYPIYDIFIHDNENVKLNNENESKQNKISVNVHYPKKSIKSNE